MSIALSGLAHPVQAVIFDMDEPTWTYFAVIALAAFLIGFSKGGIGGMLGALVTPLVALVTPIERAVGLVLPIIMLGDVFAVAAHWRRWETRIIKALLPGALIGITLGTLVLTNISGLVLKRTLGVIVILFVVYRLFEHRLMPGNQTFRPGLAGVLTGSAAGFTSTLAHAGGPLVTMYLLTQELAPTVFVATSALFFAVLNLIKVPYYYVAGLFDFQTQLRLIWLAPLVPLGVWVGRWAVKRAGREIFERVIMGLLAITALLLLVR